MRGRLATLFLSIFLLWSSTLSPRHHTNFSNDYQVATAPASHSALAPDENWLGSKLKHEVCSLPEDVVRSRLSIFCKVICNPPPSPIGRINFTYYFESLGIDILNFISF
jgi:hypothetical protein